MNVYEKPSYSDLHNALEHADIYQEGFTLDDFDLKYEGLKTVEDLYQFDDIDSWSEEFDDVEVFRDSDFQSRARIWIKKGIVPPIVVITTPDNNTQIGDGRGRVTIAKNFNLKVPVWHLVYKSMDKVLESIIEEEVIEEINSVASGNVVGYTGGGVLWGKDANKKVKTSSPALTGNTKQK